MTEVLRLEVVVTDLGPEPEWHRDRTLFGPWARYEARATPPDGTELNSRDGEVWRALHWLAGGEDGTRKAISAV